MNKFDERRRALLENGGMPPLWIFKEGSSSLESGFALNNNCVGISFKDGNIELYSGYTAKLFINADFTPYSKLKIELQAGLYKCGYGTLEEYDEFIKPSTVRTLYEFDISTISGYKYIQASGYKARGYIYNIWLE